jgi:hypothetical protein
MEMIRNKVIPPGHNTSSTTKMTNQSLQTDVGMVLPVQRTPISRCKPKVVKVILFSRSPTPSHKKYIKMTASLNYLNYLNLIGYILNCFFTFASVSVFGIPDNGELSDKYQTILTPSGWAFAIWGIIFTAEGIFAVTQMVPKYRDHPMVQDGVKIWYFVSCLVQSGWTIAFGYEVIILSLIFMVSILLSLYMILVSQNNVESDGTVGEYWLFRFPFAIHCGE